MKEINLKHFFTILLIVCCMQAAWAQQAVKGKVLDDTNQPLPGVNVLVKGTTVGTATDIEGNYSIQAPDGSGTLVFSAIGFVTEEMPINNQSTINVSMVPDIKSLNEVVVTALGIERETKTLGYAITEVDGANFTQARETNLGNALSGRIAGVNASPTATGPGGSSRIIIRGNTSLSGTNQPLYVINGIPIDNTNQGQAGEWGGFDRGDGLNSLNPDDIESISVLKGGTAAALYGSRAASGVILITTKSGKGQKGIGVDFNSTYTLERPINLLDWQYEYGSGNRGAKPISREEAIQNGLNSWGSRLDGSPVIQFDGVSRPYSAQKNNIKNFYDNGSSFTNTIAVAGGNDVANFRFSVSNLDNQSMVPNSSFNRKTFNLSANANLSKKVVFESRVQYNIEKGKNRTFLSDSPKNPNYSAQLLATNVDIRDLNPGYDERGYEELFNSNVYATNPYFAINKVINNDDRRRLLGSFSLRYNITDFLYIRGRLGTDFFTLDGTDIEPTGIAYRTVGGMNSFQQKFFENNSELIVGFTKDFSDFSVNVIAGGNMMKRQMQRLNANGNEFSVPFSYFLSNLKNRSFSNEFKENAINSLFASADIGYKGWLYLNLTGRQDWFSTLSLNDNSIFYPSAGVSFVFTEALSMPAWLNFGKLRASWAQVGGGYPEPYGLALPYSLTGQGHLGQPLMNISTSTIPNPNLKPLLNTSSEIGIELKTLDNRFGVDVAVYQRKTTDDPVLASTTQASGYNNVLLNVGKVSNKGIEVLLTGTPVKAGAFTWDVSYNAAYNKNEVVSIAPDLKTLPQGQSRTQNGFIYHDEGQPYGIIKGYKMKRDANGNIVYNKETGIPLPSEFAVLGQGVHPWSMGITNTFTYKNFNLNFLVDGKFGGDLYSATNAYGYNFGLQKNTLEGREEGIPVSGVDADGEAYSATVPAQTYYQGIAFRITDEFVYDASFIKLRQVVFGYSLPNTLLSKTPFQSVSLSFVARNLLILYKNVPNADPESNYNSGNAQGLEMFGLPTARSYGLNLMVKF